MRNECNLKYSWLPVLLGAVLSLPLWGSEVKLPSSFSGTWQAFGRADVVAGSDSVTISNGYVADLKELGDCTISFRARMPKEANQVQIWGAIRVKDGNDRYVFGLRGGSEPQVSLARYTPDGNAKFLGFAPLDFTPKPGEWYTLRVVVEGDHFQVYTNDDKLPRINVEDKDAMWKDGGVGLGGGWLPTEFTDLKVAPLTESAKTAFDAVGDQIWAPPAVDKEALRTSQRAAYQPLKVDELPAVRGDISLNGNWLFMPDQDLTGGTAPTALDFTDQNWHVLAVPNFWTPTLGWLHGETGMPGLKGLASSHGPSDELVVEENARVDAQTFDWKNTKSGWYREYIDLPQNITDRQFNLVFDAIAKISDIYVNGTEVGSNVGMFGKIDCDISKAVQPGKNVIAVHVVSTANIKADANSNDVAATAVSVSVTNEMIKSLPHGMTDGNSAGIWQPVKLVVTNPVHLGELFIQPRLDGTAADIEILNTDAQSHTVDWSYAIRDNKDKSVLGASTKGESVTVPANGKASVKLETAKLQPKLWSPMTPNLYVLDITLSEGGKVIDENRTRFGFRTFTVDGNKFLLNGKPFWLRGGNHFPATLRPNDAALAHKFIELAREGNVRVTRSHSIPFTQTWLDAADEDGMGVSFEGTWPWLMIKGEPPSADLIKVWHDEFAGLLRENRNHPSILFWTVNNEMNFAGFDAKDVPLMTKKWVVLDDMIKAMRQVDPTRPISAYSGYRRSDTKVSFDEVVTPNHFDDGDIDDAHSYNGWYNPSFFSLFNGEYGKKDSVPNRPLISQEMSTGYPRNDDWPSRSYEFNRYVPQALVGDYAYEQTDPAIFMTRQAFMTKELAEVIRRTNRDETAGVLHFAYLTWFTDVWKADQIRPKLTYYELKKALEPVLVSVELTGRHFYAGDDIKRRVCLVNDAEDMEALPEGTLTWEVRQGDKALAQGSMQTPSVPYYTNKWLDVDMKMPALPANSRVNAKLVFTLTVGGKVSSTNDYDIVVASKDWAQPTAKSKVQVFDPAGKATATLADLDTAPVTSLDGLSTTQPLVVGDVAGLMKTDGVADKLKAFVQSGGKVLLLQPEADLQTLFPEYIKTYRSVIGEITSMQMPESPVFDGIEPLDTAWFEMGQGNIPYACSGTYTVDRTKPEVITLSTQCDLHTDQLQKRPYPQMGGAPLVEIQMGKGVLIASEMLLSTKDKDPIAGRLLSNMIAYLAKP